jgi:hypothetical protein
MSGLASFRSALKERVTWFLACLMVVEALLLFVWSIPGTIALRNGLTTLLLILLVCTPKDATLAKASLHTLGGRLVLVLSLWIVAHNLIFAWDMGRSWYESLQWYKSLVCMGLGLGLVCVSRKTGQEDQWRIWLWGAALAWALHLLLNLALKDWSSPFHAVLQESTAIGSRDMESYLGTGLLGFLLADAVARMVNGTRLFPLPSWALGLGVSVTIILTAATLTRNALPVMAAEIALAIVALIGASRTRAQKIRRGGLAAAAMVLVMAMGVADVKLDPRWKTFEDSVHIAWDIDGHKWWLDSQRYPRPELSPGVLVDDSAYLRTAWLHGAIRMISHYPLGTGYDRNAFRRALEREYGPIDNPPGHAHAGLLDFTLGTGVPGGVLLVAALGALAWLGWRRWRESGHVAGLALALYVSAYILRACMDGIVRDHMLEQAMFIMGLLLAATLTNTSTNTSKSPA